MPANTPPPGDNAASQTTRVLPDHSEMTAAEKFESLAKKWEAETAHLSAMHRIALHESYQRIIGMGPVAVPLILERMKTKPDRWFWALRSITGANPVGDSDGGQLDVMTRKWLEWGKREGYV